ncbi:MAG TPA: hypothetical protein VM011_04535 [Gammaproteobacteria bacterium]|nr:hypothetical protein [Gammaproteobacteria bacterium]
MTRNIRGAALLAGLLLGQAASAIEYDTAAAHEVDVSGGKIVLLRHARQEKDLSCKSGMVGVVGHEGDTIKVGDTVKYQDYTLPVGVIEVHTFREDISWDGNTVVKKGESVCLIAGDRKALPFDDDCSALWLRVDNCKPLN